MRASFIPHDIKAILFDWDNTLVDTWPALLMATNNTRKHFGLEAIGLEDVKIFARQSTRESFPTFYGERWQEAQCIFYEQINKYQHLITLFPNVLETLNQLRDRSLKLGIISNKSSALLRKEIEQFHLEFDIILGSGDALYDKPHPEMGNIALKKLGLNPYQALFVGDSVTDWYFAQNVKMPIIAIGNDFFDGQLLARFETPAEALSSLLR